MYLDVSGLAVGTYTYTITANDAEGFSVSDSINVVISPQNIALVLNKMCF